MANDNHLIVNGTDYIGLTSTFAQCSHIKVKLPNGTVTFFEPSATYLFNVNREDGEGGTSPTTVTYTGDNRYISVNNSNHTISFIGTIPQQITYTGANGISVDPDSHVISFTGEIPDAITYTAGDNNISIDNVNHKISFVGDIPNYTAGDGLTLTDNEFSLTAHIPNRIIASNDEQQANLVHLWLSYWDGNHDIIVGDLPLKIIGNNVSVYADNPNKIIISANINPNPSPSPSGDTEPDEPPEEPVVRYAPNYYNLINSSNAPALYRGGDSVTFIPQYNGWLRISKRGKNSDYWYGNLIPDENNILVTQNGSIVYNKNEGTKILDCKAGDKIVISCPTPYYNDGNDDSNVTCCFAIFTNDNTSSSPLSTKTTTTNILQIGQKYKAVDTGWLHVKYKGIKDCQYCINVDINNSTIRFGCDPFDEWLPVSKDDIIKVFFPPYDDDENCEICGIFKQVYIKNADSDEVESTSVKVRSVLWKDFRNALTATFDQQVEIIYT